MIDLNNEKRDFITFDIAAQYLGVDEAEVSAMVGRGVLTQKTRPDCEPVVHVATIRAAIGQFNMRGVR